MSTEYERGVRDLHAAELIAKIEAEISRIKNHPSFGRQKNKLLEGIVHGLEGSIHIITHHDKKSWLHGD